MKKNRKILLGIIAVVVLIIIWLSLGGEKKQNETIKVAVKSGLFEINVTTTGELEAKSSEKILGPANLRSVRIHQIKIDDMIPDGTVVDSGDYVAQLDKTELSEKIKDKETDLEKLRSQYTKMELDTTLDMRSARNELINLAYDLEEIQIELEQSVYEPPASIRQIEIKLDKGQRALDQATNNYGIKYQKAEANMKEVAASLAKKQREYQNLLNIRSQFTVLAPKAGMVIYKRDFDGTKRGIGSQITAWDPTVATLPNLDEMISKTYVNEIDISKVKLGQIVEIGVDAFPNKRYTGVVKEMANIGEQLKNSNAKVFEVIIAVNEYDSILRPSMTTMNKIITNTIQEALFIPIECIQNNEEMAYVYTHKTRKQVILGVNNDNEIIIRAGLEEGDQVYLLPPENAESFRIVKLSEEVLNQFNIAQNKK